MSGAWHVRGHRTAAIVGARLPPALASAPSARGPWIEGVALGAATVVVTLARANRDHSVCDHVARFRERAVFPDTAQDIVQPPPFGDVIMDVIGCDNGDSGLFRMRRERINPAEVISIIVMFNR